MENLKILLCCGAGMSSGFLATSSRKYAKKKKLPVSVEARSYSEAPELLPDFDVLLLGPHYAKEADNFKKEGASYNVAVGVIPEAIYGSLDGPALVEYARKLKGIA